MSMPTILFFAMALVAVAELVWIARLESRGPRMPVGPADFIYTVTSIGDLVLVQDQTNTIFAAIGADEFLKIANQIIETRKDMQS